MSELVAPVLDRIDEHAPAAIDRLFELLRIPSVSTDPAYSGEVRRAAQWCADDLASIGFEATVCDTDGHPVVFAEHEGPAGAPTVLYYGHYDVQPPDPMDLWETGPFDPVLADGPHGKRIVARGAVDDKGQLMTFVEAFRAWKAEHGALPVHVKVMLEGEEECGGVSLPQFFDAYRDRLAADVCIVSDTGMWDIDTPAITYMLRGLVYLEATLHGPARDLHSGQFGGAVRNPAQSLGRILGALHDADGRVAVEGFYDDVEPLTDEEHRTLETLGFDEAAFLSAVGLATPGGEAGRSALERLWARPTCEINGVWGGYTGAGAKTVIPAHATAKISCRLVANQDPQHVADAVERFLEARTPPDGRWEFTRFSSEPAVRVPCDSPFLAAARRALAHVFGCEALLIGSGGSIPVVGMMRQCLGLDALLIGFGLDDDRVHSPNEKFEERCFRNGMRAHASLLGELAGVGVSATG